MFIVFLLCIYYCDSRSIIPASATPRSMATFMHPRGENFPRKRRDLGHVALLKMANLLYYLWNVWCYASVLFKLGKWIEYGKSHPSGNNFPLERGVVMVTWPFL